MEIESMTLPTELLAKFVTDTFVETGSYDGRTIEQALHVGFKEVRSIEIAPEYHAKCLERFKDDERVKLYLGDSELLLPTMLADISKPATIWLDAHIQEGYHGTHHAPLLYELYKINQHVVHEHIIMIDDFRLLGTRDWWELVTYQDVVTMLKAINPSYVIERFDSKAAPQDIIVAHL